MKIEFGKRYVRRDGTITPPLVPDYYGENWALDTEKDVAFGMAGAEKDHQVFSYMETPFDLMGEYNEV